MALIYHYVPASCAPRELKLHLRSLFKTYKYILLKERYKKARTKLVNLAIRNIFREKTGKRWHEVRT